MVRGTVSIVNNQLQFTLGSDFDDLLHGETATVTVRYVMSDDAGLTSESTAVITVNGPNHAPVVLGPVGPVEVVSSETLVNTVTGGDQYDVSVDSTANGGITVWASTKSWWGSIGETIPAIWAELPDGTEIMLSEQGDLSESQTLAKPSIAVQDNGNFAVTWQVSDPQEPTEVFMRVFTSDGTAITSETSIGTGEILPLVTALDDGSFLVTSVDQDNGHVYGSVYSGTGTTG